MRRVYFAEELDKRIITSKHISGRSLQVWDDIVLSNEVPYWLINFSRLFDRIPWCTLKQEEIELLEELSPPLDMEKIHNGDLSPVFFGSAMNNFGVWICSLV